MIARDCSKPSTAGRVACASTSLSSALLELHEPILMTDCVDVDADNAAWARLLTASPRRYFALSPIRERSKRWSREALSWRRWLCARARQVINPHPRPSLEDWYMTRCVISNNAPRLYIRSRAS